MAGHAYVKRAALEASAMPTEERVAQFGRQQLMLHRVQRGHGKRFVQEPPPGPVRRPARVAVMIALAHKIQGAIDRGTVRDRAEVARRLGFTRARITHLLDLTLLAPDLQERILFVDAVDGVEPISERIWT